MKTIGIDPGLSCAGVGYADGSVVKACTLARGKASTPSPLIPSNFGTLLSTVDAVIVEVHRMVAVFGLPDALIIEWPEVYQGAAATGRQGSAGGGEDPNDLLPLAGLDVALCFALPASVLILPVRPKLWTKGTKKAPRQENFISARMHDAAQSAVLKVPSSPPSLKHNAIDGACLAVWGAEFLEVRTPAVRAISTVRRPGAGAPGAVIA